MLDIIRIRAIMDSSISKMSLKIYQKYIDDMDKINTSDLSDYDKSRKSSILTYHYRDQQAYLSKERKDLLDHMEKFNKIVESFLTEDIMSEGTDISE